MLANNSFLAPRIAAPAPAQHYGPRSCTYYRPTTTASSPSSAFLMSWSRTFSSASSSEASPSLSQTPSSRNFASASSSKSSPKKRAKRKPKFLQHDENAAAALVSSSEHNNSNNSSPRSQKKKRQNKKKKQKKPPPDPSKWKGPLGRPVMTDKRYLDDSILQGDLQLGDLTRANIKSLLFNVARQKWDCTLQFHHEAVHNLFVATLTTTFVHPQDLDPYKTNHAHIRHRVVVDNTTDSDDQNSSSSDDEYSFSGPVTQLIGAGAAPSKRGAETLAAADTLKLLYEMGLTDVLHNPPNFKQERDRVLQQAEAAAYKTDLARAQMLLELLGTSRPRFEITDAGNNQWVASASCILRGRPLDVMGDRANKKTEAEGKALIALAQSEELASMVGSHRMEMYQKLIEKAPGQHIATLKIQPMADDLLSNMEDCIGTASDYKLRVKQHEDVKIEYERRQADRMSHGASSTQRRNNYPLHRSVEELLAINQSLQKEEERRHQKAEERPDSKEATMKAVRDALPIKNIQEQLVEALKTQQVVVVSGGTGSG
eukprot:scaffold7808_cov184-Amphora_coffeaeformis.AAC.17